MGVFDLDAARAARAAREEVEGPRKPPSIRFGGRDFIVPNVCPLDVVLAVDRGDAERFIRGLVGDAFDDFMALGPDLDDYLAIKDALLILYGVSEGESSASPKSLPRTGTRSRPTSNGSTGSTRRKRAGV
jgi:hypothetical protein